MDAPQTLLPTSRLPLPPSPRDLPKPKAPHFQEHLFTDTILAGTMSQAVYQPLDHVRKGAHVESLEKYKEMHAQSLKDPEVR